MIFGAVTVSLPAMIGQPESEESRLANLYEERNGYRRQIDAGFNNYIRGNMEINNAVDDVLKSGTGYLLVEYNGKDLEITRVPTIKQEIEPCSDSD